jgi:hypothetical protein
MTGVLLILAAFTVVIGLIGLPHLSFLHGIAPNLIAEWLDPSLVDLGRESLAGSIAAAEPADPTILGLMGVALAVGVAGILAAAALYRRGPSDAVGRFTAGVGAGLYRLARNKFYVDELYDRIVIRPFRGLATFVFEVIDRFLIDKFLVGGSSFVVDVCGRLVRWFQNGQVQRYLVALLVGGAALLFLATRPQADFEWYQSDDLTVEFEPDLGRGPGTSGAQIAFDFDGDDRPDYERTWKKGDDPLIATWTFSQAGEHQVSMWLTDAVFHKKKVVTKTIRVDQKPAGATAAGGAP